MKRWWLASFVLAIALLGLRPGAPEASYAPPRDTAYYSTRAVMRLRVDTHNTLWAQATGGTLRWQNGVWTKFAVPPPQYTGLPSDTPHWRGQPVIATLAGIQIGGKIPVSVSMPPSNGTHVSAVLPRGGQLWAALFGDGLWTWNGARWARPAVGLPAVAREITALAQSTDGKTLWLGTRRQGVWGYAAGAWHQHLRPDEPFATNIQNLQSFRGAIWASTLEDGLVRRDASGWTQHGKGALSSSSPRQMVQFQNKLFVRHSNEVVDCFDGKNWHKNVFPGLPRKQIISLAADAEHLYLGQWGGWTEWDGAKFTHHLRIPELQIVPLLQMYPDGASGSLWLGTENRGLFQWNPKTQKVLQADERHGLPDDWITALNRNGRMLFAGTFNGGLAWRQDGVPRWQSAPGLKHFGITGIAPFGKDTFIATRYGLYRRAASGTLIRCDALLAPREREIQCLLMTNEGLWLGTRSSLIFRTRSSLDK